MSRVHYEHRAGYGRDDHMADELIARAARHLGADTDGYLAQCVGLASHSVPMARACVSLPSGKGQRKRMERALRAARSEITWCVDCRIDVVERRTRVERSEDAEYVEERIPARGWVCDASTDWRDRYIGAQYHNRWTGSAWRVVEERDSARSAWREVSREEIR